MMKNFHLTIVTPTGTVFDDEAEQISLMGECGSLSILANHIPFVTNFKAGGCRIYTEHGIDEWNTTGGLLSVTEDCVRLITTSFTKLIGEE